MELIYYGLVAFGFLVALSKWRMGLYAAVVLDILRDPIRKVLEGHPVGITVAVSLVWLGVFMGAIQQNRREVFAVMRMFPRLRVSVRLMVIALLPGAALAIIAYSGGWRLALIGGISYLAPLLGFAVGFALAGDQREVYRFMTFYTVVNSVAMLGSLAEYSGMDWAVLGGMNFEWIRQKTGLFVHLVSGLYRSPDIMGLHASHICMFAALLALRPRTKARWLWIGLAAWSLVCLLLAGRRKMLGMPLVFMASYYLLCIWLRVASPARLVRLAIFGVLIAGVALMFIREIEVGDDYMSYASTLFTEGVQRSNEMIVGSAIGTVYQSGVLGAGLGSATQGRQHVMTEGRPRAWQEDGASRLFMELGVFGVLLAVIASTILLQAIVAALRRVPPRHPLQPLQVGVAAVVLANLASFLISHQQYSGDPSTGMMICMFVGFLLSCPLSPELGWHLPTWPVRRIAVPVATPASVSEPLPRPGTAGRGAG